MRAGGRCSTGAAAARPGLPAGCLPAVSRGRRAPSALASSPVRRSSAAPAAAAAPEPALLPVGLSVGQRPGRLPARRRGRGGACGLLSPWRRRPANGGGALGGWGAPWPRPRAVAARHVRGAVLTRWPRAGARFGRGALGTALPALFPGAVPLGKPVPVNLNTGFGKKKNRTNQASSLDKPSVICRESALSPDSVWSFVVELW